MKKNLLKLITILFLILTPIFIVNAATNEATSTLQQILENVRKKLEDLGKVVCIIFMIVGGYQMITASGDPKKFETGKTTLLFAAIGFIIILAAGKIVDFLESIVK